MSDDRGVSEALDRLDVWEDGSPFDQAVQTIRSELRRLRERLEEVREERDYRQQQASRLHDIWWKCCDDRRDAEHALYTVRRQRDELREAVREAREYLLEGRDPYALIVLRQALDRLSNALDGSEGENRTECSESRHSVRSDDADADEAGEECRCVEVDSDYEVRCPLCWREGYAIVDITDPPDEGETNQIYVKCRPLDSTFDQAPTDEPVSGEGEEAGPPWNRENTGPPPRHTCVKWLRDGECWICGRNEFFAKAAAEKATHADARSSETPHDAEDVRQMSDEELVEALESLAINFCLEAGIGYAPVKLHALEIKRRLTDRPEDPDAGDGEFGDPPRPGESKKDFAERVLDEAQEAPSWDAYVYSLACGLYEAERRTYPEPSMESGGTSGLRDPDEEERYG